MQLSPSVNRKALAEAERMLPMVVADARQVALDSVALSAALHNLARDLDDDSGTRFAGPDREDVADLLRWLSVGNFVLLGCQDCIVGDGTATVVESSRLGVARLRTEVLPELTHPGDLLVLAQATMPSFLRYGAYPYIVVIREHAAGGQERSDSGIRRDSVQRWSTDPRSRVPALPRLDPGDPLPLCRQTVHRGVVLHG